MGKITISPGRHGKESQREPSHCLASGCEPKALYPSDLESSGCLLCVAWPWTGICAFVCLWQHFWECVCVCVLSLLSLWLCRAMCVSLKKYISHFLHKLLHVKGHPELSSSHPFSIKQYYQSLVPKLVPREAFPRFFVKWNVTDSPNDEKKNSSCLFPKRGRTEAAQPLYSFSRLDRQVGRCPGAVLTRPQQHLWTPPFLFTP